MLNEFTQPEARLWILEDPAAVAREAARRFIAVATRAAAGGSPCRVALSGGSTPLAMYRALVTEPELRDSLPWPLVELFWGDERFVPHEDPTSNYGAARAALLRAAPVEERQVYPIPTDLESPVEAAAAYEETLRTAFATPAPEVPEFDLVFLGLGPDGHTASLFPGELPPAGDALVAPGRRPQDGTLRVTLTPRTLNAAKQVLFLVAGAGKADMLQRVLRAEEPDPALPATLVRPVSGPATWLVDRAAAPWAAPKEETNG